MKKQILLVLGISLIVACSPAEQASSPLPTKTPISEEELVLRGDELTVLPGKKKEVVYVDTDAKGNPKKKTVNVTLEGITSTDYILDESILDNIKNLNGDEEYYHYGDQLAWENRQKEIEYKGETEKELPVGVRVTYYLDGNVIEPNQLVGKSGHLKIRFDYFNNTSETVTIDQQTYSIHIPFVMMTTVFLSDDVFFQPEAKNGKIIELGNETVFVGMGIPNLEEDLELFHYQPAKDFNIPRYSELEAEVKDFKLDFTATVASTHFLDDIETQDLVDFDKKVSDLNEAKDGINKLKDGTNQLSDGLNEYKRGMGQYFDGIQSLSQAINQYAQGFQKLNQNSSQLETASKAISDGLNELNNALSQIDVEQMRNSVDPQTIALLNQVIQTIQTDIQTINADNLEVQQMIQEVNTFLDDAQVYSDTIIAKKEEAEIAVSSIDVAGLTTTLNNEAISQATQIVQTALNSTSLTDSEKETILNALNGIDLSASLSSLNQSVSDINTALSGMDELEVPEIETQLQSMSTAANDLQQQLTVLTNAMMGNAQLIGLISQIGDQMEDLQNNVSALASGSSAFTKGLKAYTGGVNTLYSATTQIQSGVGKLSSTTSAFDEGFNAVLSGVNEMKNGINEFDQKAISEIEEYAGSSLRNVIRRMRAVKELDTRYQNYSGIPEGVEGSVYFVFETEEIK